MTEPKKTNQQRRDFIKNSLWIAAAAGPLAGAMLSSCTKSGSTTPPNGEAAVSETDAVASSLGYVADATKVDTTKYPKRAGDAGAKQFCDNCQFYTVKADGWGQCQVIRNGLVNGKGWCNTWAQKA